MWFAKGFSVISKKIKNNILSKLSLLLNIFDQDSEKKPQSDLKREMEKTEMLLDNIDLQVWYMKDQTIYGKINKAHASFLGIKQDIIEDQNIYKYIDKDRAKQLIKDNDRIFNKKDETKINEWIKNSDGQKRLLEIKKTPILNADKVEYIICQAKDITEQRKSKVQIEEMSYQDNLTGLYNREYFEKKLKQYNQSEYFPLSFIVGDINGLKLTNDAFGHKKGDKLLKKISNIITNCCRNNDVVARWGGDEFVILLPNTSEKNAKKVCNRINRAVEKVKPDPIALSIALGYGTKHQEEDIENVIKTAENWMYKRKVNQSKEVHDKIIASLKKNFFANTQESPEHCQRLKEMALQLGEALNIKGQQKNNLTLLAEFHDLGKVGIDKEILQKEGDLTEDEWKMVKRHPEIGYQITSSTPKLSNIADGILSHHEWWNGEGYPQGLSGKEIPLISRIIAVVDAYDIMINGRSYRSSLSPVGAARELIKGKGSQFDPQIVDVFIEEICPVDSKRLLSA